MDLEKAKDVIRSLAEGFDPTTGEVLPKESPYNEPIVIRALFTVIESLNEVQTPKKTVNQKQRGNRDSGKPKNAGLPWTQDLKKEVASKFRDGTSISELSRYFERTPGAIASELTKQGLIRSGKDENDL